MKDEIFKQKVQKQFEFDEKVASVFDDMISRSVPFYRENLRLIVALVAKLGAKNASICDLGCSTASLLLEFWRQNAAYKLVGVDNSGAMIENARNKCAAFGAKIDFFESDLSEFSFAKSDIFIANYTLQFIRPPQRQALVRKIYENLNEKGFFIMSEKILYEDAFLAKNIIEIYADFKHEQGYTRLEIAKKRETLENVLVPYSEKENLAMLENAGFTRVQSFFKWANFESFIAFK